MDILVITRVHLSDYTGGTTVYAHDLNRFLHKLGHNITHLCFSSRESGEFFYDGIKVIKYQSDINNKLLNFIKRFFKFRKILNNFYIQNTPDLIVTHDVITSQFLILNGIPPKKRVFFIHAVHSHELTFEMFKRIKQDSILDKVKTSFSYLIKYFLYYCLERITLKTAAKIITDSEYDNKEILKYHGNKWQSKISIIPIGVDLHKFFVTKSKEDIRSKYNLHKNNIVFLVIRRLEHRMGLLNLIDAFSTINAKDASLLIVGKGTLRGYLEARIDELGVQDKVKMLGFISEKEKIEVIQASDYMIIPSEELEGFGIVTLEAWACNVPVIGTPVGAIPDNLKKLDSSFITADITPDALRDKIQWAIDNKTTLTNSITYRQHVENNYDWNIIADRVVKVFNSI